MIEITSMKIYNLDVKFSSLSLAQPSTKLGIFLPLPGLRLVDGIRQAASLMQYTCCIAGKDNKKSAAFHIHRNNGGLFVFLFDACSQITEEPSDEKSSCSVLEPSQRGDPLT
ncbi:hypothetical protein [Sporomusa ovata]|nr:hypothetical protein [Sporomusa ovata]